MIGTALWVVLLTVGGSAAGQAPPVAGETSPFVSRNWTVDDGLPVNAVTDVVQGRDGYLWLTTYAGLVRFDGVRFTTFTTETTSALGSDRLLDLLPARDGALWIRSEQLGLVRFDPATLTFSRYRAGLRGAQNRIVYQEPDGTLWVGTDAGLFRLRGRRFVQVDVPARAGTIFAILRDRAGALWVGTESDGVLRLRGGRGRSFTTSDGLPFNRVDALYEDAGGTLWAGTPGGLCRYRNGRFVPVPTAVPPDERVRALTAGSGGTIEARTDDGLYRIRTEPPVRQDAGMSGPPGSDHRLWNYADAGVYYDGKRVFQAGSDVYNVTVDREGSLWAVTKSNGLYRLRPSLFTVYSEPEGLADRYVYSVLEDHTGALWFGTSTDGLSRLRGGIVETFLEAALGDNTVYTTWEDQERRLWVGHTRGVCRFEGARCEPVPGLPLPPVRAILQDRHDAFWFATERTLCRWTEGGALRCLTAATGLPDVPIRVVAETADGTLWIGTDGGGLVRLRAGRLRVLTTADGLSSDVVRSLYEDPGGTLWVGTGGGGLNRLTGITGEGRPRVRVVRARDGLADDVVYALVADTHGRLWMSTNRGIAWVRRDELDAFADGAASQVHATVYTEADGLRNREGNGSQRAAIRARDGRLWFATQDGAVVVDPAEIEAAGPAVPVVVESVTAGGETWTAGRPVQLNARQRNFEVAYTALTFASPEAVQFRYRLDGFDPGWADAGARRTAFYTNVPPGDYTFRVMARGGDGRWTKSATVLPVVVAPFVWETLWFRVLAGLLLVGFVAGVANWRMRTLQRREQKLSREREQALSREVNARTRDLVARTHDLTAANAVVSSQAERLREMDVAKNRLFANLSHEFRTPLTLILGPLQSGADGAYGLVPEPLRARDTLMLRNGRRLLRLVNQVLDLAKLEAGGLTLHAETHDVPAFVRQTALAFVPLAERRRIVLTVEVEEAPPVAVFDREQMERVVGNLLSNALKFTPEGGAVRVECRCAAGGEAEIVVADTGVGIPAEHLAHVFDRFFQVDASTTRAREGSGIGLALAKELVELHGGTILAESRPGKGSRFTVRLPRTDVPVEAAVAPPAAVPDTLPALDAELHEVVAPARGAAGPPLSADLIDDRMTVLVVDDNADLRAYLRQVLEPDYRVVEAADGAEGLARTREALPDLVVADVMMPVMDGLAFSRALRADPATDSIPVVLLTARSATDDEVAGLETGADDYVTKPFAPDVLRTRVRNLIALRQQLRERLREEGVPAPETDEAVAEPPFTAQVRAAILARLTAEALTVETLAAEVALSSSQLYRRLMAESGVAPRDFIRQVRLDAAARLLEDGAGSVSEVAYAVGFQSLAHFSNSFRAQFGMPPSAYAASVR